MLFSSIQVSDNIYVKNGKSNITDKIRMYKRSKITIYNYIYL